STPGATMRSVPVVAEALHELCKRGGDALDVPPCLFGRSREPESRNRWCDDMEGVRRVVAMGTWVHEPTDDLHELHHRTGPAVRQQQRNGIPLSGSDMEEVDVLAIDVGGVLGELI